MAEPQVAVNTKLFVSPDPGFSHALPTPSHSTPVRTPLRLRALGLKQPSRVHAVLGTSWVSQGLGWDAGVSVPPVSPSILSAGSHREPTVTTLRAPAPQAGSGVGLVSTLVSSHV